MKEILRTLVGSRAHGTQTEESDYDYRGVFIVEPLDLISPFRSVKNTSWIENDEDNVLWELTHFCKMCAQGNPTALETLAGYPQPQSLELGLELRSLLPSFLSKRCVAAFMGYSKNQEKKFRDDFQNRKHKYAEAHVRTLYQLLHLLHSGEIRTQWEGNILLELCNIKRGLVTDAEIMRRIFELEAKCLQAEVSSYLPNGPDIQKIEDFISFAYLR